MASRIRELRARMASGELLASSPELRSGKVNRPSFDSVVPIKNAATRKSADELGDRDRGDSTVPHGQQDRSAHPVYDQWKTLRVSQVNAEDREAREKGETHGEYCFRLEREELYRAAEKKARATGASVEALTAKFEQIRTAADQAQQRGVRSDQFLADFLAEERRHAEQTSNQAPGRQQPPTMTAPPRPGNLAVQGGDPQQLAGQPLPSDGSGSSQLAGPAKPPTVGNWLASRAC
jgi:hypothetical protein